MNILVASCMCNRISVAKVWVESIRRLNLPALVACDTVHDMELCTGKITPVRFAHTSLADKWNKIISSCLVLRDWTHLLILGDDDILATEVLGLYAAFQDHPYVGHQSMYMVEPITGRAKKFVYPNLIAIGSGRMLRRELVEAIGDMFPPDVNEGLDIHADMKIFELYNKQLPKLLPGTTMTGIKSDINIWKYDQLAGDGCPVEEATSFFTSKELELLNEI